MATLAELLVSIGVDTKSLDKGLEGVAEKTNSSMQRLARTGEQLTSVGKSMTMGVTTPIVGMGAAVLKTAGDFEAGMNRVRAVSGATGAEFEQLEALAMELGRTTQFSASEAADAMGFLAMAGMETDEIMGALPHTLNLAAAGALELGDAADIVTNIMSGYGMEVEDLARVNDVLAKTFTSTNTDLNMLGYSFKYVGPVAASAGLQFEEVSAAIGLLGNAGIQGEQAGTVLRGAISRLIKPTGEVQETLERLGVEVQDSAGKMLPLADILRQLEEAGADTADMITIFGVEAGPGMQALLDQGHEALTSLTTELENAGGTAEEIASVQMEGLNGALKTLESAMEGLALAVANSGLLEWVTAAVQKVAEWVQELGETNPELLKWGTLIAAVVAAIGPLLVVAGVLISSISQIATVLKVLAPIFRAAAAAKMLFNAALWASPITWIILAIIALIAVIVLCIVYWDEIKSAASAAWDWIVDSAKAAWDWLVNFLKSVLDWIVQLFLNWTLIGLVIKHWDTIVAAFRSAMDWAKNIVNSGIQKVLGFINNLKTIPGRVGTFFRNMVTAAANQIQQLIARVRRLPSQIKSAVGNLKNLLVSAGKNIIRGLINGINNMIGSLKSKLNSVTNMIPDWKGPERVDRQLLFDTGRTIMGGLEQGITAGLPGLRSTLRDVTREIPHNVRASVSYAGAASHTLEINVTGADEEMARLIRKMVRVRGRGDVQRAFGG